LAKEDFELFEDGRRQNIDMFTSVDIPMVRQDRFLAADRPVSSDVKSNAPSVEGRLYVIVLDDLDVTALRSQFVIKAARQFVEQNLAGNDLAAVVYTSGRGDASQEFTSDRRLLLASIDKFVGRRLLSLTLAKADEFFHQHLMEAAGQCSLDQRREQPGQPVESGTIRGPAGYPDVTTDPADFERGYRAQQVLGALKTAAETLGGVRGRRKALLFFSEGIDYPIYDVFGSQAATSVIDATKDAITAAARSNLTFFTIDPRGLVGMSAEEIELDASADPTRGFDAHGLVAEMRLSQDSLESPRRGNRRARAVTTRNATSVFDRIVRTTSTYYLLGYYPPEHPRNGAFHKIEVRIKRPGLRITARRVTRLQAGRPAAAGAGTTCPPEARGPGRRLAAIIPRNARSPEQPLQQSGLTLSVQARRSRQSRRKPRWRSR
jgi:VWFA-related protein